MLLALLTVWPCEGKKKNVAPAVESSRKNSKTVEGDKSTTENLTLTGLEMQEALSEDGTELIKRPYKWFAGIGVADNKQMAIELAQREAYATISRVLNNTVEDSAERGNVANNGRVRQALKSHWEQVSQSLQRACEPIGSTTIEYNKNTRMYEAVSKVGIRGDRYTSMLNEAADFEPADLSGSDLDEFVEANKSIMEAAKSL